MARVHEWKVVENYDGSYQTTVLAADGHGGSSSQTFAWTITDTPRVPVLTNPGSQTSTNGATVTLQLNASQPDGDQLIYDASNLPPGLSIDSSAMSSAVPHGENAVPMRQPAIR